MQWNRSFGFLSLSSEDSCCCRWNYETLKKRFAWHNSQMLFSCYSSSNRLLCKRKVITKVFSMSSKQQQRHPNRITGSYLSSVEWANSVSVLVGYCARYWEIRCSEIHKSKDHGRHGRKERSIETERRKKKKTSLDERWSLLHWCITWIDLASNSKIFGHRSQSRWKFWQNCGSCLKSQLLLQSQLHFMETNGCWEKAMK